MKYQGQIFIIGKIESMLAALAIGSMLGFWFANTGIAQTSTGDEQGVTVTVKGESWDADSRGFAYLQALTKSEGEEKADEGVLEFQLMASLTSLRSLAQVPVSN